MAKPPMPHTGRARAARPSMSSAKGVSRFIKSSAWNNKCNTNETNSLVTPVVMVLSPSHPIRARPTSDSPLLTGGIVAWLLRQVKGTGDEVRRDKGQATGDKLERKEERPQERVLGLSGFPCSHWSAGARLTHGRLPAGTRESGPENDGRVRGWPGRAVSTGPVRLCGVRLGSQKPSLMA